MTANNHDQKKYACKVRHIPYTLIKPESNVIRKAGQTMEKKIEFETLDHETQVKIVETLLSYDKCHVEHANGKNEVTPNWCICATYPEDSWVSQDFAREDFDLDGFDYHTAWDNLTQFWYSMTIEQKIGTCKKFEMIAGAFVELVIQKYLMRKKIYNKYYGKGK